jgi:hypothetical protein
MNADNEVEAGLSSQALSWLRGACLNPIDNFSVTDEFTTYYHTGWSPELKADVDNLSKKGLILVKQIGATWITFRVTSVGKAFMKLLPP